MKIMIIDDERLALMQLEIMLKQSFSDTINEIKTFQLVSDALNSISFFSPDVVFLDIHMPEISGLEAAEHIQKAIPNVEIVFVTAYDEFAIQAFELHALDYVLKPVVQTRLIKTVERIKATLKVEDGITKAENTSMQKLYCFNKIKFQVDEQTQIYPKWRTAKAQELFAYLVHRRGEYVSKYKIINMFTPDIDKKRGMTQLYTIVYQIRRCLKEAGIDLIIENDSIQESYCLKVENISLDFVEWEQKIKQLSTNIPQFYEQLEDIVFTYEGNYMGEYDYLWAGNERERLLQLWNIHTKMLLEHYELTSQWTKIISVVEKQFYFNPYEYDQVHPLLRAYANLGQNEKVKQLYDRYDKESIEELDIPMSDEIVEWYESWLKNA